jgi:hypothetical protein
MYGFWKIKRILQKLSFLNYYHTGRSLLNDSEYKDVQLRSHIETRKRPIRTEVINYILSQRSGETVYLEIGVHNPIDNFSHIKSDVKYGVDPGRYFKPNPVDFKMTSDEFFEKVSKDQILSKETRFDVIFIDGSHLAPQVDKDVRNSLQFLKDDGFIVLHDCNPPSEWHAREKYSYKHTPALYNWNGTTWKAFLKWRSEPSLQSCCVDVDWGVGVLAKKHKLGKPIDSTNEFFEYWLLEQNKNEDLNLIDFETFRKKIKEGY